MRLNNADLISRKAAVSRISDLIVLELRNERTPTWNEVYHALNDLPTVDAVPVVYGTWVTDNSTAIGELIERYCSLCHCRTTGLRETWFPYCPNCGAKMELARTAEGEK